MPLRVSVKQFSGCIDFIQTAPTSSGLLWNFTLVGTARTIIVSGSFYDETFVM